MALDLDEEEDEESDDTVDVRVEPRYDTVALWRKTDPRRRRTTVSPSELESEPESAKEGEDEELEE